jgi:hypothetical protein
MDIVRLNSVFAVIEVRVAELKQEIRIIYQFFWMSFPSLIVPELNQAIVGPLTIQNICANIRLRIREKGLMTITGKVDNRRTRESA